MTLTHPFLHPAFLFIALALLLPFIRGNAWRWLLFIPPLASIVISLKIHPDRYWVIPYLGQDLILGRVDLLSILFTGLFGIQSLVCTIFAFHVREKAHHMASGFFVAGSFGCILAGDYWTLFIFWEIMSVSSTFLIWLNDRPGSTAAGFRYLIFLTIGGILLLAGVLLRYRAIGTFSFDPVDPTMARHYDWLILTGFCINAAVVPLHAWLTDAYPEATVPGAVFLSAFTTHTAVYCLARCFAGHQILVMLGTAMAIYGVIYAIFESETRRVLSYLVVSQVGLMVAGIGMGTNMAMNGAIAQAYTHTLYNGLLFMAAGCVIHAAGDSKLFNLGGLAGRIPLVLAAYLIGAFSMSCLPLFNGFISTTLTIQSAVEAHRPVLAVCLGMVLPGTFFAVGLRLPYFIFVHKSPGNKVLNRIPVNMYLAMGVASALCIIQGVFPEFLYRLLPYPARYQPYTGWKVAGVLILLGLTGLGFYVTRIFLVPRTRRYVDFDVIYRLCGRGVMVLVSKPLAWADELCSELYRTVGLRAIMGAASGVRWFDRNGIDRVVDGTAYSVRGLGKVSAKIQTGKLQDQLAWMAVLALCLFALFWFWL